MESNEGVIGGSQEGEAVLVHPVHLHRCRSSGGIVIVKENRNDWVCKCVIFSRTDWITADALSLHNELHQF
jgi:hypothetical protein